MTTGEWGNDAAQPTCPDCGVVMRDGTDDIACPNCGHSIPLENIKKPIDEFDGPAIHGG